MKSEFSLENVIAFLNNLYQKQITPSMSLQEIADNVGEDVISLIETIECEFKHIDTFVPNDGDTLSDLVSRMRKLVDTGNRVSIVKMPETIYDNGPLSMFKGKDVSEIFSTIKSMVEKELEEFGFAPEEVESSRTLVEKDARGQKLEDPIFSVEQQLNVQFAGDVKQMSVLDAIKAMVSAVTG